MNRPGSIRWAIALGAMIVVLTLDGCAGKASIDHPHGCDVFNEGQPSWSLR